MSASYAKKDEVMMAFDDGRAELDHRLRRVMARVRNEVMAAYSEEFAAGLEAGVVRRITFTNQELAQRVVEVASVQASARRLRGK